MPSRNFGVNLIKQAIVVPWIIKWFVYIFAKKNLCARLFFTIKNLVLLTGCFIDPLSVEPHYLKVKEFRLKQTHTKSENGQFNLIIYYFICNFQHVNFSASVHNYWYFAFFLTTLYLLIILFEVCDFCCCWIFAYLFLHYFHHHRSNPQSYPTVVSRFITLPLVPEIAIDFFFRWNVVFLSKFFDSAWNLKCKNIHFELFAMLRNFLKNANR